MAERTFARPGYYNEQGNFEPQNIRAKDVIDTKGVSVEEHQNNATIHISTEQAALINGAVQQTQLGTANGVATLGSDGKLNASQIDLTSYQCKVNTDTYAEMLALDTTIKDGCPVNNYVFVKNASGDPTVSEGWAIYRRVSSGNIASDFVKTSEEESIDITLPDFEAMNSRISANETAAANAVSAASAADVKASTAKDTADNALIKANAVDTEAKKLDCAFCTSEADMASKNLRTGALVFMLVENN